MGHPWAPPTPARQSALPYRDGWGSLRNERSPRDSRALSRPPQKACAEAVRVATPGTVSNVNVAFAQLPPDSSWGPRGLTRCESGPRGLWAPGGRGQGTRCSAGPEQPSSHLLEGVGGTGRAGQVVLKDVCGERSGRLSHSSRPRVPVCLLVMCLYTCVSVCVYTVSPHLRVHAPTCTCTAVSACRVRRCTCEHVCLHTWVSMRASAYVVCAFTRIHLCVSERAGARGTWSPGSLGPGPRPFCSEPCP